MKYVYITVKGENEIEVDERFHDILFEMDTQEQRSNDKHARPHHDRPRNISLDSVDYEGEWFDDGTDILGDLVRTESYERFRSALMKLTPGQRDLIDRVYVKNEKIIDIAQEAGVSHVAIQNRLNKIRAQLKKFFS